MFEAFMVALGTASGALAQQEFTVWKIRAELRRGGLVNLTTTAPNLGVATSEKVVQVSRLQRVLGRRLLP